MLRISSVLRNSFAVRTNFKSLFISPARDGFKSIEGVRALNMIALLLCHMVMAKMFLPYLNKTEMSEVSILYNISWITLYMTLFYPISLFYFYFTEYVKTVAHHRKSGVFIHRFFLGH